MTRILIVKTSSLGDVVHALPVVDDVLAQRPGSEIDWVAEEAFADLPRLHPGVRRTLPVAIRRWRRSAWVAGTRGEIQRFTTALRAERYDCVLDLQGLLKSAWIALRARGTRCGLDWASAREPLASLAYQRRFRVARDRHAIDRNRELAAAALGYALPGPPRVALRLPAPAGRPAGPYVVCLHATSAERKLWPEPAWRELLAALGRAGLHALLPWGAPPEHARALRIAAGFERATVLPRTPLPALASLLAGAEVVVGVDTGLAHLAAAVGAPVIGIYAASDPVRVGVRGFGAEAVNLGGIGHPPEVEDVVAEVSRVLAGRPRC